MRVEIHFFFIFNFLFFEGNIAYLSTSFFIFNKNIFTFIFIFKFSYSATFRLRKVGNPFVEKSDDRRGLPRNGSDRRWLLCRDDSEASRRLKQTLSRYKLIGFSDVDNNIVVETTTDNADLYEQQIYKNWSLFNFYFPRLLYFFKVHKFAWFKVHKFAWLSTI